MDLRAYDHSGKLAEFPIIVAMTMFVVTATALSATATGLALRPVARMSAQAEDWVEHNPGARFNLGEPTDEITALGATLDELLARIDNTMAIERHLTDEIAHELRTPLAGMLLATEIGLDSDDEAARTETLEAVRERTMALAAVIESLLTATRTGFSGSAESSTVRAVLDLRDVPASAALRVTGDPDARIRLPVDLLARILGPLLDNAAGHARTCIEVSVTTTATEVHIAVSDDGPGLPPGVEPNDLFQPGVTTRSGGTGLGLALARRLARGTGGEVTADPARTPAVFRIRLPRA